MLRIYETINKKMERSECAMRQKKTTSFWDLIYTFI